MVSINRIDSIVFDLKQSIDDLTNEIKMVVKELDELTQRVEKIEKK